MQVKPKLPEARNKLIKQNMFHIGTNQFTSKDYFDIWLNILGFTENADCTNNEIDLWTYRK